MDLMLSLSICFISGFIVRVTSARPGPNWAITVITTLAVAGVSFFPMFRHCDATSCGMWPLALVIALGPCAVAATVGALLGMVCRILFRRE